MITPTTFSHYPTPLEPADRLSEILGGPRIFIKRDDCTGLSFGGNKCRKLDYLLADALAHKADSLITVGGIQSNHVRQTAAFAAKAGLRCSAVLEHVFTDPTEDYMTSGNLLLDQILGADIHMVPFGCDLDAELDKVAKKERAAGRNPYIIPMGGSNMIGSLGYVRCATELIEQCTTQNIDLTHIILASGSGGTQAGLVAGFMQAGLKVKVQGFSVSPGRAAKVEKLHRLVGEIFEYLDLPPQTADILLDDGFYGAGYGHPEPRAMEAIALLAKSEALLLDPVYTGKAMAGLIDYILRGNYTSDDVVIFLHTGGTPSLFAYRDAL